MAIWKTRIKHISGGPVSEPRKQESGSRAKKGGDILLDLSDVTFLSEQSLAVLIHALKAQNARGAALPLLRPSAFVRRKSERTNFSKFFPIEEE
jgi:anti-anti-sigma factor